MFELWSGGELYECGVPREGEEIANISKEEAQCAMYTR